MPRTDFTAHWHRVLAKEPALSFAVAAMISVRDLEGLLRDAFGAGIDHHAAVTRQLVRLAAEEARDLAAALELTKVIYASDAARDELLGPASLKPEFEDIFGGPSAEQIG